MSKVDKHISDDDLSFVEIQKPLTDASNNTPVSNETDDDNSFGFRSKPFPAPPKPPTTDAPTTTIYERLETQWEMSHSGSNGETSTITIVQHSPTKKRKVKRESGVDYTVLGSCSNANFDKHWVLCLYSCLHGPYQFNVKHRKNIFVRLYNLLFRFNLCFTCSLVFTLYRFLLFLNIYNTLMRR